MKKYKAVIIEDEEPARELLKQYLQLTENIELIGEYGDGFSGLKAIHELKPAIVFLDVQMPKITGLELLELLEDPPSIIFTTAYDAYAIKAFDMNAVDYLLKPFSKDRFVAAVEKAITKIASDNSNLKKLKHQVIDEKVLDKIVVKSNNTIHVIPLEQVNYIAAEDDYVMIHANGQKHLKYQTMKYYEEHLDKSDFIRIHRSYIVNVNSMQKIEKYGKESYVLQLKTGEKLKVSRSCYQELKKLLAF
ncbi:LytTR family DNA-binding domain-containing protein [Leptobacterium sp. I13]|uniref:LytR/AlgR family response regulator transcription factor n=1 Tax=Leptobacterium meishanense TaxID=3128904 RepID=UPI0030EBB8D3